MAKTAKQQLLEAQERLKKEQEKIEKLQRKIEEENQKKFDGARKSFDNLIKYCLDKEIDASELEEGLDFIKNRFEQVLNSNPKTKQDDAEKDEDKTEIIPVKTEEIPEDEGSTQDIDDIGYEE